MSCDVIASATVIKAQAKAVIRTLEDRTDEQLDKSGVSKLDAKALRLESHTKEILESLRAYQMDGEQSGTDVKAVLKNLCVHNLKVVEAALSY
jgi:glucose-6-phosphate-specific signal transduction histidine kinase